jgi:hypothetical protein
MQIALSWNSLLKFQQTSFCCWIIPINYLETVTRITGFGQAFILDVAPRLNVGDKGNIRKLSHFHTSILRIHISPSTLPMR